MIGISDAQRAALASLAPSLDPGTYLAGGVATGNGLRPSSVAGSKTFFVPSDFDPERLEERLAASSVGAVVTGRARGTLHLEVGGVPASVLSYRYPLLGALRANAGSSRSPWPTSPTRTQRRCPRGFQPKKWERDQEKASPPGCVALP